MISIIILIAAYRYYSQLADKYGKTKWVFGLLAMGIYLGIQAVIGLCYGSYLASLNSEAPNDASNATFTTINVISWLVSIVAVWAVHDFLDKKFKEEEQRKPSIDIDKIGGASKNQKN